jgi:hypothetical protein
MSSDTFWQHHGLVSIRAKQLRISGVGTARCSGATRRSTEVALVWQHKFSASFKKLRATRAFVLTRDVIDVILRPACLLLACSIGFNRRGCAA